MCILRRFKAALLKSRLSSPLYLLSIVGCHVLENVFMQLLVRKIALFIRASLPAVNLLHAGGNCQTNWGNWSIVIGNAR